MDVSTQRSAEARERLICEHLPLVSHCLNDLAPARELREDLTQAGAIGLIYAADHFDPRRGVKFATYARPHIRGHMLHHLRDEMSSIRMPHRYREVNQALRIHREQLRQELGREPSFDDLARATGIPPTEVAAAVRAGIVCTVRSWEPQDEHLPNAATDSMTEHVALRHAIAQLPWDEQRILVLIFWRGLPQLEVAQRIGRSQMHVSRTLRHAIENLRDVLED